MSIQAVIFDMGGTIETFGYTRALRLEATPLIRQRLAQAGIDPGLDDERLLEVISSGLERYKRWSLETLEELPPARVWGEYVFAGLAVDPARLAPAAEELAFLVETRFYSRAMRPEMPAVLAELRAMGLKIGLISNVNSRGQVPTNLALYGIRDYFDPVVLSSEYGRRKPDPAIFHHAARLAKAPASRCAYVGDRVLRDVLGARRAGYGLAVQIRHDFRHGENDAGPAPDAVIEQMSELVDLLKGEPERSTCPGPRDGRRLKGILFDAGDILYYRRGRGRLLAEFLAELGLRPAQENERAGQAARAFRQQAYCGEISREQYHESLLRLAGVARPADIARGMQIMRAEEDDVHYFEGVPETLAALKAQGFLLGIVTDTAAPLHAKLDWFERGGFGACWDSIISSRDVGARKPDPRMYRAALEQLGLEPGQALFVGHKAVELDGARAVGLMTAAFNQEPGAQADFTIQKFADLLSVPVVGLGTGKE